MRCRRVSTPNSRNTQFYTCFNNSVSIGNKISLSTCWTTWCVVAGADPGIFYWGGPNFGSERTYWTFFVANYFSPTSPPTSRWEGREDYVFSSVNAGRRWRGKYCFASRGEQRRTDHSKVPKSNHIFEYPWNLVKWQNATRVSLKN